MSQLLPIDADALDAALTAAEAELKRERAGERLGSLARWLELRGAALRMGLAARPVGEVEPAEAEWVAFLGTRPWAAVEAELSEAAEAALEAELAESPAEAEEFVRFGSSCLESRERLACRFAELQAWGARNRVSPQGTAALAVAEREVEALDRRSRKYARRLVALRSFRAARLAVLTPALHEASWWFSASLDGADAASARAAAELVEGGVSLQVVGSDELWRLDAGESTAAESRWIRKQAEGDAELRLALRAMEEVGAPADPERPNFRVIEGGASQPAPRVVGERAGVRAVLHRDGRRARLLLEPGARRLVAAAFHPPGEQAGAPGRVGQVTARGWEVDLGLPERLPAGGGRLRLQWEDGERLELDLGW